MRILLSAYACSPNKGSESNSGWGWATHLASRGLIVHVLTTVSEGQVIEAELSARTYPNLSFSFVEAASSKAIEGRGLHYLSWQRAILPVAKALHRDNPFDLVHHVTFGSIHVPTFLWKLGVPTIHGPVGGGQVSPVSMLGYFKGSRTKEIIRTLQVKLLPLSPWHRRAYRKLECVFATNNETLELAERLGASRVCLSLDSGIPEHLLAEEPRTFLQTSQPVRLLWVGRMLPRKALPLALDGLAKANRAGLVATLTILGDGLPREVVQRMLEERGLTDCVFWTGKRVPWSEVQEAYRTHDAFLFTSLRDSFGTQLLEALAAGLPVLTLNHHGARTFIPDEAALKIDVRGKKATVSAIGSAIREYASAPTFQKDAMSRAGWLAAHEFVWSKRARRAERVYAEILSRTAQRSTVKKQVTLEAI